MNRILHISDTHFGTEQGAVVKALQAFTTQLQPQVVVLTGDITQRARRQQFAAAAEFLQALPAPVIAVPGNHDIPLFNLWARWRNPYGEYRRCFGKVLAPLWENAAVKIVAVNSSRPERHKNGVISQDQVQQVAAHLRQSNPAQLRIVIQHHPVCAVQERDYENLALGREQAVPAWVDAGMDILLAGHIHLPYVRPLAGYSGRQAWTAQAGTALSHRVRDGIPNSVNVIEHHWNGLSHHCHTQRWDYDASLQQFAEVARHVLAVDR